MMKIYTTPRPKAPLSEAKQQQAYAAQKKLIIEMLVMAQLVQDLMIELKNLPEIRERFRYETAQISEIFNQTRKRLRRALPQGAFEDFENDICGIVDNSEDSVKWVRNMVTTQMVNRIPYEKVQPAVLIGIIGGFVDIMQRISKLATGKKNGDYTRVYGYLKYIDDHMGFKPMNGQGPDFAGCNEAMTKMFLNIGDNVDKFLKQQ